MDFIRKDIHTSILKASKYSQLTIDDDFNVPDTKDDIDKIISKDGYIVVEDTFAEDGRVKVTGTVYFKVLYQTTGDVGEIEVFQGDIPFVDHVNIDYVSRANQVESQCKLEDLTVSMINSRKLEVRGLIGNGVNVYEDVNVNGATDLENGQGVECQYQNVQITETAISKRDVFKIKEEIEIPQSKPNIKEIMWSSVDTRNLEIKPIDGKISIHGEVEIFVIYKGKDEHLPVQYLFSVRSISRELECSGAREDMVLDVESSLGKGDVSVKTDADGEDRIILVDYGVDMRIKMYQDSEVTLLKDMYSPQVDIVQETENLTYENLLMRNVAKAKINHRRHISGEEEKILQICHIYGNVDIDDINIHDDDIHITGVVKSCVLYISGGNDPMSCMEIDIPFNYTVDTVPLSPNDSVRIVPSIDQLSATMLSSEEIEIKALVNLGISIFSRNDIDVITNMTVHPIDYEKKAAMPGIVGYMVKKGDTIWSLARKYYATTESIREVNNLESDYIKEGDKLIIVKS